MQQQQPSPPPLVFCAAALSDATLLARWERHLLPLQQTGRLTIWSEQHLQAGSSRQEQIDEHFRLADCIVLLLSPDFFASDECFTLMEHALERQQSDQVRVVPLLLRPVAWRDTPLASLSYLPTNGRPITSWRNRDEALYDCVNGMCSLLGLPSVTPTRRQIRAMTVQQQNYTRLLERLRLNYETLLKNSLQGATRLELGLAEKTTAISNAASLLLRLGDQEEQELPTGTTIVQVYEAARQELLILGAPGAGKSTLLTELALHLVMQAETDESSPLPVIVPLSTWATKRPPLETWLGEQISQIYGIPRKLSTQWVREQQFLPLLDGLDEMSEAARPACIAAINTYHRDFMGSLVVCSRSTEYEIAASRQRLTLQNAVVVQPLTNQQVDDALRQGDKPLARLRRAMKENPALREIAMMPLMLNLLRLTYQGISVRRLPTHASELQQNVLQDYVKRMVTQKGDNDHYPLQQTYTWLGYLAQRMRERNQTIFYLEHLQPDWLPISELPLYRLLAVSLPAIAIGVLASLLVLMFLQEGTDLVTLLQYGMLGGFLGGLWSSRMAQGSTLTSNKRESRAGWGTRLIVSILIGLLFGLSFGGDLGTTNGSTGASYTFNDWLRDGLFHGVLVGLGSFLLQVPFVVISRPLLRPSTNLMRRLLIRILQMSSAQHALQGAIVFGLTLGLSDGLSSGLSTGINRVLTFRLSDGLNFGLSGVLTYGLNYGFISLLISLTVTRLAGDIGLIEHLHWTWRSLKRSLLAPSHLRRSLFLASLIIPLVGLSYALFYARTVGPDYPWTTWASVGLSTGLSIGLSYWLLFGLFQGIEQERIEDKDRRVPNQGIQQSIRNSVVMSLISGGIIGIISILNNGLNTELSNGLMGGLSYGWTSVLDNGLSIGLTGLQIGVIGGCFIWLLSGGVAVVRHYIIRLLLTCSQAFPLQAVSFLDDATARILLRRVGGGYSFTHRLLLDHFADQYADTPTASAAVPPPISPPAPE